MRIEDSELKFYVKNICSGINTGIYPMEIGENLLRMRDINLVMLTESGKIWYSYKGNTYIDYCKPSIDYNYGEERDPQIKR